MRVFIAGPMRGRPQYNFPAFYAAEETIAAAGHAVVNPARMDDEDGFDRDYEYGDDEMAEMIRSFASRNAAKLAQCDAIALLPDWDESEGAKLDLAFAQYLGLKVIWASTGMTANVCVELVPNG